MSASGGLCIRRFSAVVLVGGLIFLYVPTLVVIVYSFNDSRLGGVWTSASLRWYGELFSDRQFLRATANSFVVATLSATLAAILGTLAGLALARMGAFRGRVLFGALLTTPLVMPEVITGLSLLLLFVAAEQTLGLWSGRGIGTIVIAHASLAMAYVALIVQARLSGMSRELEEAAADLGARPWTVFIAVTLPMIAPAIAAGWLLAFVLSLDDLVIASFVSGPQSTTLPMAVFSSVRLGVSPKINALTTLLVVFSALCLMGAVWLQSRRNGRPWSS
ncbi:MAG: ABC transporter permease subunit [Rhodospirillaceae bacterium]|nr:ABC transporter permease subunit [Rhodospirillaceae bacterium]